MTQDNGARALGGRLRMRVLELRDLAGWHMAGKKTDQLWISEAAAILANGAVYLPDAAELDRLRAAETAALRLLNGLYHHDGETCANKTDVAALRAVLAPEGSAGTAQRYEVRINFGEPTPIEWTARADLPVGTPYTYRTDGLTVLVDFVPAAEGSARDGG